VPCAQGSADYILASVIYLGEFHFISRLLPNGGTIWNYDGRIEKEIPQLESHTLLLEQNLQTAQNKKAHICIYRLVKIIKKELFEK